MSLTGINNLSYLTYGAIGLTGIILAVASSYDNGGEDSKPEEKSSSESIFSEPAVPISPTAESDASPLSNVFGESTSNKEEPGVLDSVFGESSPNKEEPGALGSVFGSSEPKKESGVPAFGGKKKKRRTKKAKKSKKHRKTKHLNKNSRQ